MYNGGMTYPSVNDYRLHTITAYTVSYNCHSCRSVTVVPIPTSTPYALPVPKEGRIKDCKYIGDYYLCAPCHKQARKHEAAH